MTTSELVAIQHLKRKAVVYIRQSSPQQIISNQESLRLQYALKERAIQLGWDPEAVVLIDADLGLTAASAENRNGFKELIAQVTLGEVGIILSFDVTRLARNCSDWYPLLDICGYKQCLIADRDGVYDPGSPNGRFLLGLKGQLSEMELHTIRSRMTAGTLSKAQRGELAMPLPIGLVRDPTGRVTKTPNQEVCDRVEQVFTTFLQRRSASKVLQHFNAERVLLPRRDRFGDIVWKKPTVAMILQFLKNPAYAGAFVYGRTQVVSTGPSPTSKRLKRMPVSQWKVCIKDKFPAYVSWETFERIQTMLVDNYAEYDRNKSRGVPRPGSALLHGIVYCGECGHKLVVQYKTGPYYLCNYLRQQYGVPVCQRIHADLIDRVVVEAFFECISPIELNAYQRAVETHLNHKIQLDRIHQQQIERLRYEVELARRQFNRVDPDNRLVAAELERRWEVALKAFQNAESEYQHQHEQPSSPPVLPPDLRERFEAIGHHLPDLWRDGQIDQKRKKALLRCLIDKVVIHRVAPDRIHVRIVWKGGVDSDMEIPTHVNSMARLTNSTKMEDSIVALSTQGIDDQTIARQLTEQGFRSPKADVVLTNTVRIIRVKHRIFHRRKNALPRQADGFLTIPQLAKKIGKSIYWFYHRINNGTIQIRKTTDGLAKGLYLFPDTPDLIRKFNAFLEGKIQTLVF